jgi:hypothetical protein
MKNSKIEGLLIFLKNPSPSRIVFYLKYRIYELFHPEYPWLTPKANSLLIQELRPYMKGFEWGSGRSTIFFSTRVAHLVSVEHDPYWFKQVNSILKQKGIKNVDYIFAPPLKEKEIMCIDWSTAFLGYEYLQKPPRKPQLLNYFNAIKNYPDDHFDLILVDGIERVACMLNAIPKLKPGGMLILDDSDKDRQYRQVFKFFESWKRISLTDQYHGETTFWIKPSAQIKTTKSNQPKIYTKNK